MLDVLRRMIGTAWLYTLEVEHRPVRYAIRIFTPEARRRGYGREATERVPGYAIRARRFHRVELRVLELSSGAIGVHERRGSVREGVERAGMRIGEAWHHEVLVAVLEQDHSVRTHA